MTDTPTLSPEALEDVREHISAARRMGWDRDIFNIREVEALLAAASRERDLVRENERLTRERDEAREALLKLRDGDCLPVLRFAMRRGDDALARATASEAREADLIRRAETAAGWRSMDSAPKDGTRIDLLVRRHNPFAVKTECVPDCHWDDGWWRPGALLVSDFGTPISWRDPDAATAQIAALQERVGVHREVVGAFVRWAEQKCPCHNDDPNPCPLCGASVENLEGCKAADNTLPSDLLARARRALSLSAEPATGEKEGGADV